MLKEMIYVVFLGGSLVSTSMAAPSFEQAVTFPALSLKHGAQGTGNYKGKRDRHEKAGPQNERKKKKPAWTRLKK